MAFQVPAVPSVQLVNGPGPFVGGIIQIEIQYLTRYYLDRRSYKYQATSKFDNRLHSNICVRRVRDQIYKEQCT